MASSSHFPCSPLRFFFVFAILWLKDCTMYSLTTAQGFWFATPQNPREAGKSLEMWDSAHPVVCFVLLPGHSCSLYSSFTAFLCGVHFRMLDVPYPGVHQGMLWMDTRAQLVAVFLLPCFPLWGPFKNAQCALPWCPSGNALNGRQGTVGRRVSPSLLPSVGSIWECSMCPTLV